MCFDQDVAPLAVASIVAHSEGYQGSFMHRVVPSFVWQWGDRTLTGSGNQYATIPCERSFEHYGFNTIGMALMGKDTGSGQLFLTMRPTPHLNFRYPILGHSHSSPKNYGNGVRGIR